MEEIQTFQQIISEQLEIIKKQSWPKLHLTQQLVKMYHELKCRTATLLEKNSGMEERGNPGLGEKNS